MEFLAEFLIEFLARVIQELPNVIFSYQQAQRQKPERFRPVEDVRAPAVGSSKDEQARDEEGEVATSSTALIKGEDREGIELRQRRTGTVQATVAE